MNITHSEAPAPFLSRYGRGAASLAPLIGAFGPQALREWIGQLGIDTFVGSSGRVFPVDMKAAPLLRAWLQRLRESGVRFHMRHAWRGWDDEGRLVFDTAGATVAVPAGATVLALGGASWPRLGSNGAWVPLLAARAVRVEALLPANCGFDVGWSEHFSQRFAGHPVRSVEARFVDADGIEHRRAGEFIATQTGIEGSLVYALSAGLRDTIATSGSVCLRLDLAPGLALQRVVDELLWPRGTKSMSNHLRSRVRIDGVKAGLLREAAGAADFGDPHRLASLIKDLPLTLRAPRPIAEAISSAGGISFSELDERLMIRRLPGVFCAGEMLDWEAPTGGYLLTACFASGRAAGKGAAARLQDETAPAR